MKLDTLLHHSYSWAHPGGEYQDAILGSMARVVRSLSGESFPGWSLDEQRIHVMNMLRPHILKLTGFKTCFHSEVKDLSWQQRRLLLERRLISPCMAARQEGCELFIPKKQDLVIMTNEEEHVVIHSLAPRLELSSSVRRALKIANTLEEELNFAKNDEMGYLTSLSNECGDAVQLFVLLHLPAMACSNVIHQLHAALEKLDLEISPVYADDKEDTGNVFILRTQPAKLAQTHDAMTRIKKLARNIAKRELKLRTHILEVNRLELCDLVGRSIGIIRYATRLSFRELVDSLSLISLGLHLGLLESQRDDLDADAINKELFTLPLELSSAHLRHIAEQPVEGSTPHVQALRSQLAQRALEQLSIQFKPLSSTTI